MQRNRPPLPLTGPGSLDIMKSNRKSALPFPRAEPKVVVRISPRQVNFSNNLRSRERFFRLLFSHPFLLFCWSHASAAAGSPKNLGKPPAQQPQNSGYPLRAAGIFRFKLLSGTVPQNPQLSPFFKTGATLWKPAATWWKTPSNFSART